MGRFVENLTFLTGGPAIQPHAEQRVDPPQAEPLHPLRMPPAPHHRPVFTLEASVPTAPIPVDEVTIELTRFLEKGIKPPENIGGVTLVFDQADRILDGGTVTIFEEESK